MDAKLQELCRQAHEDRIRVGMLDTDTKNRTLELAADALMAHEQEILEANAIDMERGRERNMPQGLLDRLKLDHDRLLGMADGLRQVAKLEDPIGEVMSMRKRPNGLIIGKVRVAIGVVGIIFEARPNVTSDAFGLCFKSGNCAILKGGSDAIHSNIAIVSAMQEALRRMNIPKRGTQSDREHRSGNHQKHRIQGNFLALPIVFSAERDLMISSLLSSASTTSIALAIPMISPILLSSSSSQPSP